MNYRLSSYNPHRKQRYYSRDTFPEWLAEQKAAALNAMPAMIRDGIIWSAEPVRAQASRPNYRGHLRGEQ